MNNAMYILRKKNMNYIQSKLVNQFGLKLCFKNKNERIYKNNEMLITCKNKYISIFIYNDIGESQAHEIANQIS